MGFKSVSSKDRHSAPHRPEARLAQYDGAFATVGKITIYAKGMEDAPLAHHYLLIEVLKIENVMTKDGRLRTCTNRCILAERTKDEDKFEDVVKELDPDLADEKRQTGTVKYEVDLTPGNQNELIKIKVNELVDTLIQAVPSPYTLFEHNCWKFSHDGFRALIHKFKETSDVISSELKVKLEKALNEMLRLWLPNDAAPFVKSAIFFLGVGNFFAKLGASALSLLAKGALGAKGIALAGSIESFRALAIKTVLTCGEALGASPGVINFFSHLCLPGVFWSSVSYILTACSVAVVAYLMFRAIQYGWSYKKGNSYKVKIMNFGKILGLGSRHSE